MSSFVWEIGFSRPGDSDGDDPEDCPSDDLEVARVKMIEEEHVDLWVRGEDIENAIERAYEIIAIKHADKGDWPVTSATWVGTLDDVDGDDE